MSGTAAVAAARGGSGAIGALEIAANQRWPIAGQLVIGLVGLAIGGFYGILQALNRIGLDLYPTPIMGRAYYYQGLTIHGVLLAFLFTFAFANSFLSLTTIKGFNRPLASTWLLQLSFVTLLLGALLAGYTMFTDQATVLYTFYAPLPASPLFYLGAALLVVSTWLVSANQLLTLRSWRREHPGERIPLLAYMSIMTYLMWDLASLGVAVEVLFFLLPWSLGWIETIDPEFTRTLFWYTGHAIVYFWLLPAYVSWYAMIPKQVGGRLPSDALGRLAFIIFLLFSTPVGVHHQFLDPGIPIFVKALQMSLTFFVAAGSFITAFTVGAALESGGRARGGKGLLGWIRTLPWDDPSVTAQLLAMLLFVIGGATGIVNASYTLNLVVHNTAYIPAHFHLTVGTAVALTIIGVCYWLVPYFTGRQLAWPGLARLQAWLWAIGMFLFSNGQFVGGLTGEPRRTMIGNATYLHLFHWDLANWLTAIGGTILGISGLLFFVVILGTVLAGAPLAEPVTIPQTDYVHGPEETWAGFDRLGLWFGLAVALVVLAYGPFLLTYLPLHPVSPPVKVY